MNILDTIGNTPLIRLSRLEGLRSDVTLYGKAEFMNPSGSVKDRAAKAMLLDGIASGKLTKDKTIIDATSGNTGIAYAMLGAALGYRVKLCIPANVTQERKNIMYAYGAQLVETSPLEGIDGAYEETQHIIAADPERYFYPDQYANQANPRAHHDGTAEEILRQTDGQVTHFIAGTGTSGTFMGTVKRLREAVPGLYAVMMQPDLPFHGIEGIKHSSARVKASFFDEKLADEICQVSTEQAYGVTRQLARREGLFVGISSGANVYAAMAAARKAPPGAVLVTVLCDGGYRYLSNPVWEEFL